VPSELTEILGKALRANLRERTDSAQALAAELAPFAQEPARAVDIRLSGPPSIRFVNSQRVPPQPLSLPIHSHGAPVSLTRASVGPECISEAPFRHSCVTESLLRNPRFPSDNVSSWSKRWRSLRGHLASHPNVGAAWLFALASVGAGIACALLAAWLQ
jgi:hypothetical protein